MSLLALVAALAMTSADDLDAILDRHEQTLERMHSLRFTYEVRLSLDEGRNWTSLNRSTVLKQGRKLRVRDKTMAVQTPRGTWKEGGAGFEDLLYTPDGRWSVMGIDPEHPPKEPVSWLDASESSNRISGRILPPQPFGPWGYKDPWLFQALIVPGGNLSLREFCNLSPSTSVSLVVDKPGNRVWQIEVPTSDPVREKHTFQIAEEYNYLVTSRAIDSAQLQLVRSVMEFERVGEDLSFPKHVRGIDQKKPQQWTDVVFTGIKMNEPIADSDFAWRFPEGAAVADETSGREVFHIWGKNGPAMTFQTVDELNAHLRTEMTRRLRASAAPDWWLYATFASVSLLLIVILVLRRRQRKALAS